MKVKGFSLIELMTVISLLVIFSQLGGRSVDALVQFYRSKMVIHQLYSDIYFIRALAIKKNSVLTVCPFDMALRKCVSANNWEYRAIFIDRNKDGQIQELTDEVIKIHSLSSGRMVWRSFGNKSYLSFNGLGYHFFQNGHFLYCPDSLDERYAQSLIINSVGRVRIAIDQNQDGIIENALGQNVSCTI